MNFNIIYIIISIIIVIIIMSLSINYYYGKKFHPCTSCSPNNIYLIPIPFPDQSIIECLYISLKKNGRRLDPSLNFNNSQGKKLNANDLTIYCPQLIDWFLTKSLFNNASNAVGESLQPADETEQYRIFARLYDDDKDFLNWHYDNNFTKGNRYTLVIPLLVDDCNTAEFQYKDRKSQKEIIVKIPLGKGVLYNGSDVYHRITPQKKGCKRMVVIIPLYENYNKSLLGKLREKMRNITYQSLAL